MENVLFRSRILFQKRIYSIFFGTKAAKRKLSIFKERWFDIANRYGAAGFYLSEAPDPLPPSCYTLYEDTPLYLFTQGGGGGG
jgi:hypothetical protein